MSALIEYGAQAMAVHGGLLAKAKGEQMKAGYLAALRDIEIEQGYASNISGELKIKAIQEFASEGNMIYQFTVTTEDKTLVSGRATVVGVFNIVRR